MLVANVELGEVWRGSSRLMAPNVISRDLPGNGKNLSIPPTISSHFNTMQGIVVVLDYPQESTAQAATYTTCTYVTVPP